MGPGTGEVVYDHNRKKILGKGHALKHQSHQEKQYANRSEGCQQRGLTPVVKDRTVTQGVAQHRGGEKSDGSA